MKKYSKNQIKEIINKMTLDFKVGQLFLLAYPGKDPEVIRPLIEKYGISGCYISQDNAETFEEAETTSALLQKMGSETPQKIPLLLGVDQEGAWGVLVPESHTGPGNLALGAIRNSSLIHDMYGVYGQEMLSVGYNALLGPCADINIDPLSPIIGTRSFGEFPDRVAHCVQEAVKGASNTGILTTLKHFPGHGGTSGDTHREIPKVDKSLDELMKEDLLPFAKGIEAGADIVMTAHICFPQIDPEYPATMSAPILKDILRNKLGFNGVILSDSMNMGAIRKFYNPADSTLLALKAGVDIVMLSEEHYDHSDDYLPKQIASLEIVKEAIMDGRLPENEVDEKLFRILEMKLNHMKVKTTSRTEDEINKIDQIESDAARKSFILLQRGLWPMPTTGKIICVNTTPCTSYTNLMNSRGIGPNQKNPAFDSFRKTLEKLDKQVEFVSHEEVSDDDSELFASAAAIILVTEDYPLPGEDFAKEKQQEMVQRIAGLYANKTIIVGLRSSYELAGYPEDVSYLCSYSSRTCSAVEAAILLAGRKTDFSANAPVTARV